MIDPSDSQIDEVSVWYQDRCKDASLVLTWDIGSEQVGGTYKLRVNDFELAPTVTTFRIREFFDRSFDISVAYDSESYSPGETVTGKVKVSTMDGSSLSSGTTYITNGAGFNSGPLELDEAGSGIFTFTIPLDFKSDFYGISVTLNSGELSETKSDSIAIIQNSKIFIDFTPESGKFVYNLKQKIFFEAFVDENRSEHAEIKDASLIEKTGESQ